MAGLAKSPSHTVGLEPHKRFNPIQVPVVFRSPSHPVGLEHVSWEKLVELARESLSHPVGSEQDIDRVAERIDLISRPSPSHTVGSELQLRVISVAELVSSPSHAVGLEPTMQMTITCTMFFRHYPTQWA